MDMIDSTAGLVYLEISKSFWCTLPVVSQVGFACKAANQPPQPQRG